MSLLILNLFNHPSGLAFDGNKVLAEAVARFPEAIFSGGDQAEVEAERAETFWADQLRLETEEGPVHQVVASLRRKAASYGQNYTFELPFPGGGKVQGLIRSVGVQFLAEQPIPEALRQRLIAFLRSLGVGFLEESQNGPTQPKQIENLPGPSRFTQQARSCRSE